MLHRLALALGRTVGELEDGMTAREFRDWHYFLAEHPLPAEIADIHGAMQLALLANINKGRDMPVMEWRDFLIIKPRQQKKPEQPKLTMAQRMKAVANSGR